MRILFRRSSPLHYRKIQILSYSRYGEMPDSTCDTTSAIQGIIISGVHDIREDSRNPYMMHRKKGEEKLTEINHVNEFDTPFEMRFRWMNFLPVLCSAPKRFPTLLRLLGVDYRRIIPCIGRFARHSGHLQESTNNR